MCQNKKYLVMSDSDLKAPEISRDQSLADENYRSPIDPNSMIAPGLRQFASESAGYTTNEKRQAFGRQKIDHSVSVYQKVGDRKNQHKAIHLTPRDLSGQKSHKGN